MPIEDATDDDLPAVLAIYNDVIATSTAIHLEEPATLEERQAWNDTRKTNGYPLLVARTAGERAGHGLEPRHLRTIRSAAEREVDLIEQVVAPLRRQRGAESRGRGEETAREIARLTTRLHTAIGSVLERGGTVLLATHDEAFMNATANRIHRMEPVAPATA